MKICIIGAGTAGLLLLLLLRQSIPPSHLIIIDPHFDGGDLIRRWHSVLSNTPLSAALDALKLHFPGIPLPAWVGGLDPQQPTPLATLGRLILDLARPVLQEVLTIQSTVKSVRHSTCWEITHDTGIIEADTLISTVGGIPKSLRLPIPSIPLEVALDPARLRSYLQPGQRVVVFGTRHSGVLVLRNCLDCSGVVTGIYKGGAPFSLASEGDYDGLKLEAAQFAETYRASPPPMLTIVPFTDTPALIKATRVADWVIYAIGIEPREVSGLPALYDGRTGALNGASRAWGFGIAFPSQAPDGVHWDVGISAFLDHMAAQVSAIVIH